MQPTTIDDPAAETVDLGPLPALVGYAVRRAQMAVFEDFHQRFAPLDLRPAEFSVLLVVDRNAGLPQRRVADALGIKPSNLVGMVARLAARGLLEQRPHPRDRRAVALHLTRGGQALLRRALDVVEQHESEMLSALTMEQRGKLFDYLRALAPKLA